MKKLFSLALALSIICTLATPFNITAFAAYSNLSALQTQINSTGAAGSVYEIEDGTYTDVSLKITSSGASENPIIIKAKNPGKVIIKGKSTVILSGSYITLEGIRFEEITSKNYPICLSGSYCTINSCSFYDFYISDATTSDRQWWVDLQGSYNTVSNSFFSKRTSLALGQMIVSESPDHHTIKNCYFGDIDTQTANGYEAVRLGGSSTQDVDGYTVLEGCFFYKCNGEGETISLKCSNNILRYNTFYNNNGAISLRHGDDNEVSGNVFIAPGLDSSYKRTIGITIYGDRQNVHDNYFYNFIKGGFAVVIGNGNTEKAPQDAGYDQVTNLKLYNNTMIGGERFLRLGKYASSTESVTANSEKAPQGKVFRNAVAVTKGTSQLIFNGNFNPANHVMNDKANAVPYHNVVFSDNYMYNKKTIYTPDATVLEGYAGSPNPLDGINAGYFKMVKTDGFFIPEESGIGARISYIRRAPKNPLELLPSWIVSTYYTSGRVAFDVLSEDPFNSSTAHINNIVDFDISYGVLAGNGKLSLVKAGVAESKVKLTVSGNPELKFIATPDDDSKVSAWYVNGTKVTNSNKAALGIEIKSADADTLTINDIAGNFDIKAEFAAIPPFGDGITVPISYFSGISSNPFFVKNHLGNEVEIKGCYTALAVRIPLNDKYTVEEYGYKVSEDGKTFSVKAEALMELSSNGGYGMFLYGFGVNRIYYVKPYVVYRHNITGEVTTLEGSVDSFCVHD